MKVKSNFYWWWDTAILRLCVVETYKSQTRFLNSIENRLMLFCLKFELYCISTLHWLLSFTWTTFNNCLKIITFSIFLNLLITEKSIFDCNMEAPYSNAPYSLNTTRNVRYPHNTLYIFRSEYRTQSQRVSDIQLLSSIHLVKKINMWETLMSVV